MEGTLGVNGKITGPVELRARGTLTGCVDVNDIRFEGALNYEGCRLQPGLPYLPTGIRTKVIGVMTFNKGLKIDHRVFMNMKISSKYADHTDIADEAIKQESVRKAVSEKTKALKGKAKENASGPTPPPKVAPETNGVSDATKAFANS